MVKIALLHQTLPQYMEAAGMGDDAGKLQVVLATSELQELERAQDISPEVLVLDLDLLGQDAGSVIAAMEEKFSPELTLVVYSFAKWDVLEQIRQPGRQLMRAPVSVRALRTSMVSLIVRNITQNPSRVAAPANAEPAVRLKAPAAARRFTPMQLSGLQEVRSSVDCECPNQVADLVMALNAFEDYSNQCKNRNEEDAKIHALLGRLTGHARSVMEVALKELCEFEKIDPDNPGQPAHRASDRQPVTGSTTH